jgi:signal transduction histidine kinase
MARAGRLAVLSAGLAFGAVSIAFARSEPGYSFGGASAFGSAAELVAGYALLAVGLVALARRGEGRLGGVLLAASFAWFLLEWNNPGNGSAFVFTLGLVLYVAAPPIVAHAVLGYPGGRVRTWPSRLGLALGYAGAVLLLGLLPALVFDPAAEGCTECPRNLLLMNGDRGAYESFNRIGVDAGLAWALLLIVLAVGGFLRSTPARRRLTVPVVVGGVAYLSLVAADFAYSLDRGFLTNDGVDRRLWLGEAAALCALALAVAWSWLRGRRTRSALAGLVIELAESPPPGGLRDGLAAMLGDASLQLAYPLSDGRLVDGRGRPAQLEGEVTPLVRGDEEVALLAHRRGLLDDPVLAEEVAGAARLALENERLQAQARAQLEDLRASRARIVDSGDVERRRTERDLHDGAQQRLVGLSLGLRLARSRLGFDTDPTVLARIEEAETELRAALAELRELAHGIFPAVLADEGLAAALEALSEEAPIPIELTAVPEERFEPRVEAAAYFLVSETATRTSTGVLKVSATRRDGHLVVELEGNHAPEQITELEDRIGALDGSLAVVQAPSRRVTICAEIPCES